MQPVPSRPPTELLPAARRIASGSLGVREGERVLVVHDRPHADLAAPIAAAVTERGGEAVLLELEELGARPHTRLHDAIRAAMGSAQASVLVCGFHGGEYAMRTELVEEAGRLELRHAHMVGVTARSMIAGVAVDSRRVEKLAADVLARMKPRSVLRIRSASGTDLTVKLDARHRWVNHTGVVRAGTKENLPSGELVTCPGEVSGVYVANGTLGDATGSFAGSLTRSALILQIEAGAVKRIEGSDGPLARRIQVAMRGVVNLDRVALVSLGTNFGLKEPIGEIFVDQTLPSVHLSLGLTFPERTGASWTSESWIGFTATGSDVELDGTPLMKAGRYLGGLDPTA